jgi:hypothetical protein
MIFYGESNQALCHIPRFARGADSRPVQIADQLARQQLSHRRILPKSDLSHLLTHTLHDV